MYSNKERAPAVPTDVEQVRAALESLEVAVATLRRQLTPRKDKRDQPSPTTRPPALPQELVTLDQMAAMVHRSKRSLERYRGQLPAPRFRGRRGQTHLWDWPEVRPWLEETFGLRLPEHFPGIPR
jgi:hypothetical protein